MARKRIDVEINGRRVKAILVDPTKIKPHVRTKRGSRYVEYYLRIYVPTELRNARQIIVAPLNL